MLCYVYFFLREVNNVTKDNGMIELDAVLEYLSQVSRSKHGGKTPFTIQSSRNLREDCDIVIKSGNPVEIYVSHLFLLPNLEKGNVGKRAITDRIDRALDKIKDCHKTLSNYQIIGYRESVALLKEAKKWARSANPDQYIDKISSIFFKKEYTVSVTDSLTGLSVAITGKNPGVLEKEAIRRLIHLVESDQEQEEVRDMVLRSREPVVVTKDEIPQEIILSTEHTEFSDIIKVDYVYETKIEEKIDDGSN